MKSIRLLWIVLIIFGALEAFNFINLFPPTPMFDPDNLLGLVVALVGAIGFTRTKGR